VPRDVTRVAVLCFALLTLLPNLAGADWLFTPFFGYSFKGSTTLVTEGGAEEAHWSFGGTAMLLGRGVIGAEGLFVYTPHFFEAKHSLLETGQSLQGIAGSQTYAVMGNAVLAAPLQWNEYGLRPFVSGGLGLIHAGQQTSPVGAFTFNKNLFGYNIGGGAIGFITDRTGLRFDLRFFRTFKVSDETGIAIGDVQLRYWTGSVGVVIRY
jgi:hypothetical protein